MTPRKRLSLGIAGGILVTLSALVAFYLLEKTEEIVDRGFRGEAATDSFLALRELFLSMEVPTRTVRNLRHLPPSDHALWVVAPTRHSPPDRLVKWAEEGGHLVVVPAGPWGQDPLLEALSMRRFGHPEADENDGESTSEFASERPPWPLLYAVDPIEILRSDGAPDAAWMLTRTIGDGTASVLSDGAFLHNDAIARQDHALIAWRATVLDSEPAGIWLAIRDPSPSIWLLMSAQAWPVAVSLALGLLAGLLFFARRSGPLLETTPRDRRQLAEHVRATGDYLWSVGCESALLDAQRQALGQRLGGGRQPADEELEDLARGAAASAGISPEAAQAAVTLRDTRDRQEFTQTVQALEALRRST